MTGKSPKPIFKKPLGANEGEHSFCDSRISGPILCELCGTPWPKPESDDSRPWGYFLGRQYVDECCGKIVQQIFEAFGGRFTEAFLEDFAKNPMAPEFGLLRHMLPDVLKEAVARIKADSKNIELAQARASKLKADPGG